MSDSTPYAPPSGRLIGKRSAANPRPDVQPDEPVGHDEPTVRVRPSPDDAVTLSIASAQAAADGVDFWDVLDDPPAAIGPYEVQREIARGGMGIVYEAYHPQLDRQVALKILRADADGDPDAERRFLREARAAAKLRHAGIVAVHDVGVDDEGRSYLVMDLVPGESLKALLGRRERLPALEAASLLEQVARAVAHAHDQGILHRDLKPHNVLIDPGSGAPLLTDFGLAKLVRGVDDDSSARRKRRAAAGPVQDLTQSDEVLGTPRYMAPEQIDQRAPVGPRTDVYALGVVLYECLTGERPFDGPTYDDLVQAILQGALRPPSALAPDVPPQLEAVVLRCLEREPRLRYRSALALANDLERFQRAAPVSSVTHRSRPVARGGVGWTWVGLALAMAALGASVLFRPAPGAAPLQADTPPPGPAPSGSEAAPLRTPAVAAGDLDLGLGGPGLAPERLHQGNVRRHAEAGYPDAMHLLGFAILTEQLPGDPAEGLTWLERAAEAGYVRATIYLARIHDEGLHGQAADRARALGWLRRAAEQHDLESLLAAGAMLIEDGDFAAAEALLASWSDPADPRVGSLHGVAAFKGGDRAGGISRWRTAAEAGSTQAMRYLAQVYDSGQGVGVDREQARGWLERAASAGDATAMLELGVICELGSGQPRDLAQARAWYRQALEAGHPEAQVRLDALGGDDK